MTQVKTKNDLLGKLRSYAETPDDDIVKIKKVIEWNLLRCPELLYALNNTELEKELFDKNGNINAEYDENGVLQPLGEWDRYLGRNILDYLYLPDVQTDTDCYLCYTVSWNRKNQHSVERYASISFTVLVSGNSNTINNQEIGIARHDLISAIIRERFDWQNIFGTECRLIWNKEATTDSKYFTRTLVFECILLNSFNFDPYLKVRR